MSTYQNQNQFAQTPVLGQVSAVPNPNIMVVKINPESTALAADLTVGQVLKLIAGAANEILADVPSGITDGPVYGVIVYNPKKNIYRPGDTVEIACEGSVLFLEASAAINRGAKVATTIAGPTVAANVTAGNQITGIALDQASAGGQLIRVQVAPSTNGS